ncbi:Membrane-bound lytic murein transglycosylase D precursor [Thiorhodovibrio litoralis]|nr:Membrane-bound lytic murein transglycosylase D precursor [Thiorhodovibrio litoralis]
MTVTEHSAREPLTGKAQAIKIPTLKAPNSARSGISSRMSPGKNPSILPGMRPVIHRSNIGAHRPSAAGSIRRSALLATLPLAMATLSGCGSTPGRNTDMLADQPRSVSAREYGFVRPAIDPQSLARNHSGRAARGDAVASLAISGNPWQRISGGRSLNIPANPRVAKSLEQLARNKNYLNELAARARPYLHLILTELERSGLPTGLALLPEIESRYNPRAVSPMRAAGMWQFMPYTGKEMGLEQNAWYDGRYDVMASTRGAVRYLRELNQDFDGDWALTLAAYNAGPARVRAAQKANERAGKPTDYWSLNLPGETEEYVPKLLAVASLVQSPQRYGQRLPALPAGSPLAVVTTQAPVDLAQAARASGISARTLARLNPALKKGRNRAGQTAYLLVPVEAASRLSQHLSQVSSGTDKALASTRQAPGGSS